MPPAARRTDQHICEAHEGETPVVTGAATVNIAFRPAARVGDRAACPGRAEIVEGSANVFIEGASAARLGDATAPKGVIVTGAPTVNIGSTPEVDALLAAAKVGMPFLDCATCRMGGDP
jgi:uncharacterized Zn-binding protein involved in type VI secretion